MQPVAGDTGLEGSVADLAGALVRGAAFTAVTDDELRIAGVVDDQPMPIGRERGYRDAQDHLAPPFVPMQPDRSSLPQPSPTGIVQLSDIR